MRVRMTAGMIAGMIVGMIALVAGDDCEVAMDECI